MPQQVSTPSSTARKYILTDYDFFRKDPNRNPEEWAEYLDKIVDKKGTCLVKFAQWQHEKCPTTGNSHIQGAIHFNRSIRGAQIQECFGYDPVYDEATQKYKRGPWNQPAYTDQAFINYCAKEATRVAGPYQWGEPESRQGERTDMPGLLQKLKNYVIEDGMTRDDIVFEHTYDWHRFKGTFDEWWKIWCQRTYASKPRKISVTVLWGDEGTGKTERVWETNNWKVYSVEFTEGQQTWFDNYDGQDVILFDDFTGQIPLNKMLRYLDRYPLANLPVKNKTCVAKWTKVFITSNLHPEQWYDFPKDVQRRAFLRRFHSVQEIKKTNV